MRSKKADLQKDGTQLKAVDPNVPRRAEATARTGLGTGGRERLLRGLGRGATALLQCKGEKTGPVLWHSG